MDPGSRAFSVQLFEKLPTVYPFTAVRLCDGFSEASGFSLRQSKAFSFVLLPNEQGDGVPLLQHALGNIETAVDNLCAENFHVQEVYHCQSTRPVCWNGRMEVPEGRRLGSPDSSGPGGGRDAHSLIAPTFPPHTESAGSGSTSPRRPGKRSVR